LFLFSPVRVIDLTARPANAMPHVNAARARQVMERVREQQADTLAGEVRALEQTYRELATLEAQRRDEMRQSLTNEPMPLKKISTAQGNAAKAQATAEEELKRVNEQFSAESENTSALTNVTAPIRDAQAGAGHFQAEALEALALADRKFEPAYQAQAEAN